jgi:hypothetical protein
VPTYATVRVVQLCGAAAIAAIAILEASSPKAQTTPAITISRQFPSELNPDGGGAPNATLSQAAAFAWQEFIAANWPAGPQQGQPGQRDAPSMSCKFGDPTCTGPLVWETFRGKVEIFPGTGNPPGYVNDKSADYGYDALPQYANSYGNPSPVPACDPTLPSGPTPWVNLDETDQITLNSMYAGVVTAQPSAVNSAPQIVRFLAKAN